MRYALVACSKLKEDVACQAKYLYLGSLFQKTRRAVEAGGFDGWFILSALHGLVCPETIISPYDVSLPGLDSEARKYWGHRVSAQISASIPRGSEIVVFAGEQYRRSLSLIGYAVTVPYAGLGIGKQLHELTARGAA